MGIEHIISGMDASELNVGYSPLIPQGLEYLNFFGGSAPLTRNLAPGKPGATIVGNPPVGSMAEGIKTSYGQHYIQTAAAHTAEMTLLAVAKAEEEGENFLISNYASPAVNTTLRLNSSGMAGQGRVRADSIAAYKDGAGATISYGASVVETSNVGQFATVASRFKLMPLTGFVQTNDFTSGGTRRTGTAPPAVITPNLGVNLRIGSGTGSFAGAKSPRILAAAIWSRALSDAEIAQQYRQLREFYASQKGVSV